MTADRPLSIAEKEDHRPYIDGWRGVAILMVVAVHTSQHFGNTGVGGFLFPIMEKVLNNGARGVQLFFILSAFTLFNSSLRRFQSDSRPVRSFYIRRSFRILPLWLLMTGTVCYLTKRSMWVGFLSASFLFGFVRFDERLELLSGGWSLFVEETFYLMLPVIFARVTSLRKAATFTAVLFLVSVLWCSLPALGVPVPTRNAYIIFFPLNQWYIFGMGIVLYYLLRDPALNARLAAIPKGRLDLIALCLMPVIVSGYLSATSLVFVFCIYVSSMHDTLLNRIMNDALLKRFGIYCYSIYLLHFNVIEIFAPRIKALMRPLHLDSAPAEVQFAMAFPVVAAICLVVGHCCFVMLERPSVRLGKKVVDMLAQSDRKRLAALEHAG